MAWGAAARTASHHGKRSHVKSQHVRSGKKRSHKAITPRKKKK
jgi:hypothetical protein